MLRAHLIIKRFGRTSSLRKWSSTRFVEKHRPSDADATVGAPQSAAREMGRSAAAAIRKVLFEKDPNLEKLNSSSQLSVGVIESMLTQFIESSLYENGADGAVIDARGLGAGAAAAADLAAAEGPAVNFDTASAVIDYETLDLLTAQTEQLLASASDGDTALRGVRLLEDIMRFYLAHRKPMAAAAILLRCQRLQETSAVPLASIAGPVCGTLLQQLVESCNWHYAAYTAMYMIERDLDLNFRSQSALSTRVGSSSNSSRSSSSGSNGGGVGGHGSSGRAVATIDRSSSMGNSSSSSSSSSSVMIRDSWLFHTVSGLMAHPVGVLQSLRLMQQIAQKRRSDLARMFSFQKAAMLSRSLNTSLSLNFTRQQTLQAVAAAAAAAGGSAATSSMMMKQLPAEPLEALAEELLSQYRRHGWFSHSLAKMLVSIALAGDQQQVAARFVSQCLQTAGDDALFAAGAASAEAAVAAAGAAAVVGGDGGASGDAHASAVVAPAAAAAAAVAVGAGAGAVEEANELLAMLRTFSQADGIVQSHSFFPHVSAQKYSAVTFALLREYWSGSRPLAEYVLLPPVTHQLQGQPQQQQRPGPLTAMALMNSYWVLAFRTRDAHIDLPAEAQGVSTEQIHRMDAPLRQLYAELSSFHSSNHESSQVFSPKAGFERRAFRIMCDDLGLQHKVVARAPDGSLSDGAWTSGADLVVQVQKTDANTLRVMPAPLDELLQRDAQLNDATNSRKYDALPLYWSTAQGFLRRMDKEQLSLLAHRQLNAMRNYPMISWSLLWMQELRERNIPLQHGTLRSALKMCDKRSDIYGLLEILYFAEQEAHLGRTAGKQSEYGALLHRFNEQPRYSAAMQHFRRAAMFTPAAHDSSNSSSSSKIDGVGSTGGSSNVAAVMDGSQLFDALASVRAMDLYGASSSRSSARKTHGTAGKAGAAASQPSEAGADTLSNHDWNKACLLAFRSGKQAALPMHSYREAFTEVMVLMRRCGVDLENNSLQTIMRFLVYSKHNPDLLSKLAKRMYLDRSVYLTHIECIALSTIVLQQISGSNRCISLAKPAYHSANYLVVFPDTQQRLSALLIDAVSVLGTGFLRSFESCWARQRTKAGRTELFSLLRDLLHPDAPSSSREVLVRGAMPQKREAVALVCVYAAYLVGANDGAYRRGFELLYLAHTMLEEGRAADAAARRFAADYADEDENGDGDGDGDEDGGDGSREDFGDHSPWEEDEDEGALRV